MFFSCNRWLVLLLLGLFASGRESRGRLQEVLVSSDVEHAQAIVTWDEHSLFVDGRRLLIYSGEFHPFRLPVPTLWLDVLQKIRSLGFNAVSFYVNWALIEGSPGEVHFDGVFALEPFFEAAKQAGIYLIARPGPYINAEVSGGGFPGWLQRIKGHVRTADEDFLNATDLYTKTVCEAIAKAQITNGGPVILVQPENEYSHWTTGFQNDPKYFNYVKEQFRNTGIVVPLITNDAGADGNNAPGSAASFDIYGHDGYPLGFDCSNPENWPARRLPTDWWQVHQKQSPSTPYTIPEFQGGSFDPWGGPGFDNCLALTNAEFVRVFWKNLYSFGVTIYNVYMIYGGTNWGNMGHPNGYTSYDYGAAISEDRSVAREKFSEAKLQANFLAASPAYLTAASSPPRAGAFVSTTHLTTTSLTSGQTEFVVVRHTDYASKDATNYTLFLESVTLGRLTVPQVDGSLTLHGRDSKVHVIDYDLFGTTLLYSTAEILTAKKYESETVLIVHGGSNEQHELAVDIGSSDMTTRGQGIQVVSKEGHTVFSWQTSTNDRAAKIGPLTIWFVSRQSAYNFWVLDVIDSSTGNTSYAGQARSSIITKGGYLMRTANIQGNVLKLSGDINATTEIQIVAGAPRSLGSLVFNEELIDFTQNGEGVVNATLVYEKPKLSIPDLSVQKWSYIDSLPEIKNGYSDEKWVTASLESSNNTYRKLTTPTSLYSSDYGFHAGTLLYRGHFVATGKEKTLTIDAQGGQAFGFSIWLNKQFLGSFVGNKNAESKRLTVNTPKLQAGMSVITVVIDNMGYDENWIVGQDDMKNPRGILDFALDGHNQEDVTWKVTGNLGGEKYFDKTRGPLNEGGMWAERHGYHLPLPSDATIQDDPWKPTERSPMDGIAHPGIGWFVTSFDLDMPRGYDIPLALQLPDIQRPSSLDQTEYSIVKPKATYRVQIFINGWQFGKYVHHLGPQTMYIVPEGIWDYHGKNFVALSLWAMEEGGARIDDIKLVAGPAVQTGYQGVETVEAEYWKPRPSVY